MTKKWQWLLRQITRRLWFRASLLSVLAVASALIAIVIAPYVPSDLPAKIGADAVDNILNILASSLLAVTIFSLSTAVSAYGSAARSVTPRATKLLIEDVTTQNALATFLGSFLYSLVGIIALSTGAYGMQGRVVLFVVTLLVIVLIVVTLLGWIDHLSKLGTVSETTGRVEAAATEAMEARARDPHFGGRELRRPKEDVPPAARPITSQKIGYVQHIDVGALAKIADEHAGQIFVTALPGTFADPSRPVAWVLEMEDAPIGALRDAFTIDHERSFEQDPRFGMAVLAEIASRALSPAMNDSGTAIDVIGRAVRVLSIRAGDGLEVAHDPQFPRVFVPGVRLGQLFDDIFQPIARDGAAFVEVQVRLQKALLALANIDARYARHAVRHARGALARAEAALQLPEEITRVREIAGEIEGIAQRSH